MSYSFMVSEHTKEQAKAAVHAAFDEMVAGQPEHAHDRIPAEAAAHAMIDAVDVADGQQIHVSCNGYLMWSVVGQEHARNQYTGASVNCTVSVA